MFSSLYVLDCPISNIREGLSQETLAKLAVNLNENYETVSPLFSHSVLLIKIYFTCMCLMSISKIMWCLGALCFYLCAP